MIDLIIHWRCRSEHQKLEGFLSGIFHFFIYFQMAVLLNPALRPTSALFQAHSSSNLSKTFLDSFICDTGLEGNLSGTAEVDDGYSLCRISTGKSNGLIRSPVQSTNACSIAFSNRRHQTPLHARGGY